MNLTEADLGTEAHTLAVHLAVFAAARVLHEVHADDQAVASRVIDCAAEWVDEPSEEHARAARRASMESKGRRRQTRAFAAATAAARTPVAPWCARDAVDHAATAADDVGALLASVRKELQRLADVSGAALSTAQRLALAYIVLDEEGVA